MRLLLSWTSSELQGTHGLNGKGSEKKWSRIWKTHLLLNLFMGQLGSDLTESAWWTWPAFTLSFCHASLAVCSVKPLCLYLQLGSPLRQQRQFSPLPWALIRNVGDDFPVHNQLGILFPTALPLLVASSQLWCWATSGLGFGLTVNSTVCWLRLDYILLPMGRSKVGKFFM